MKLEAISPAIQKDFSLGTLLKSEFKNEKLLSCEQEIKKERNDSLVFRI